MLKYDSKNVCNEFQKSNDSLTFIFCVTNLLCCQEIRFQYVEIKAHTPFQVPTLYNWNIVFSLLFFLSGYLKVNLTAFFAFCATFLPPLFPCYLFHTANCYKSTSAYHPPISSLFWYFLFTPAPVSVWSYVSMAKSTPMPALVPCWPHLSRHFAQDPLQIQILYHCIWEMWPFAPCSSDHA